MRIQWRWLALGLCAIPLVAIGNTAPQVVLATPGSVVVVSLGFDTYGLDPIGDFALTTDVYHEVGRRVAATGRRLVILQEGGYHRPSLGENARAWLRGARVCFTTLRRRVYTSLAPTQIR